MRKHRSRLTQLMKPNHKPDDAPPSEHMILVVLAIGYILTLLNFWTKHPDAPLPDSAPHLNDQH